MLYKCNNCNRFGFTAVCPYSSEKERHQNIPLNPAYYPEFEYQSKGFLKDIIGKRKAVEKLDATLESVLEKYEEFKAPYFVNFVHISNNDVEDNRNYEGVVEGRDYTQFQLFQEVLHQLGFTELAEMPDLLNKLLLTTILHAEYNGFSRSISHHILSSMQESLESWIAEVGPAFRQEFPMFLYYVYTNKLFEKETVSYHESISLRLREEAQEWLSLAEQIFYKISVQRLSLKLQHFQSDRFVTIHAIDAMDGYAFEDFLVEMFQTLGYGVEATRRGADQGADLFVEKFDTKTVIQAKNYSNSVGNSAVQEVIAAKAFYACDEALVITNAMFTKSATELAESAKVRLVDRRGLERYLDDYNQRIIDRDPAEAN